MTFEEMDAEALHNDNRRLERERNEAQAEASRYRAAALTMSAMMGGAASALEEMGIPTAAKLLRELREQAVAQADLLAAA